MKSKEMKVIGLYIRPYDIVIKKMYILFQLIKNIGLGIYVDVVKKIQSETFLVFKPLFFKQNRVSILHLTFLKK